jgi:beta-glucosidase
VGACERYHPRDGHVTENGANFADPSPNDGLVSCPSRVAFLHVLFAAALDAIDRGDPLRECFVWTLIRNFEWIWGYEPRFGILQPDRRTQQRTPKESALFLARVARTNALCE